jgi:biopolymer transport protein TolR
MVRKRRKTVAEINVVPYIDVMLVLLVIFMVTAPLMNLGVDIDLPKSNARPVEQPKDPITISVRRDGSLYLMREGKPESITPEQLREYVAAVVQSNPKIPVLVGGDTGVEYGKVYEVMAILQSAGAPRVGLLSVPKGEER